MSRGCDVEQSSRPSIREIAITVLSRAPSNRAHYLVIVQAVREARPDLTSKNLPNTVNSVLTTRREFRRVGPGEYMLQEA